MQFTIEPNGEKVGITTFIDGYRPDQRERFAGVVFLILDQTLGEYDIETKVGFIEFKASYERSGLKKQPFSKLAQDIDQLIKSN